MRRLVYGLLAVWVGIGAVQAKIHTNKTFLMPRSHNENMAMEYTGWHKQIRKMDDEKWGSSFQLTGFYQASTNHTDLGKYFGKYNEAAGPYLTNITRNTVPAGGTTALEPNIHSGEIQDFIWVAPRDWNTSAPINDELGLLLDPWWIIHDNYFALDPNVDPVELQLNVKGTMRPEQTSYGVVLDYHQKLDRVTKGLYFKASAPLVHVENDLQMCYTGDQLTQALHGDLGTASLATYLSGEFSITDTQDALTHAKICGDDSTGGVADIDLTLGYNFLYKEHKHCGVNVAVTIPTTRKPTGEKLFEAVLGYGGHWAVGMGVDCAFELWQHGKKNIEFVGAFNYKYVLEATEQRTLGFKHSENAQNGLAGKVVPMGHYFLGGQVDKTKVFPLANVLTRDVGVAPGSRCEGLANLAFNWCSFTLDCGYNFFAKEAECVTVKCWQDDTFGVAASGYNPANDFSAGSIDDGRFVDPIQRENLLPQLAATPAYVTHKALIGMSYGFNKWEYPFMVGLGGSWEWVQGGNSALNGYNLWLKAGMTF